MPSVLTDEQRSKQYGELRDKKRKIEKAYHISGAVIIGLSVFIVLPSIYTAFLHAMFRFEVRAIWETALIIAMFLTGLFGISRRSWHITGASLVLMIIVDAAVRQLSGIPEILPYFTSAFSAVSAFVLFLHWNWEKLRNAEGFPDFDISYEERVQHEKTVQRQHMNRLLAEGAERSSLDNGDMTDLLDESKSALPAELTAYKDRFTLQTQQAGERRYAKNEMDEL